MVIVPELSEVMDNHDEPLVTAAVQFIVPPQVLVTLNVVLPADEDTSLLSGTTDSTQVFPPCVTVTFLGLPFAPGAVTVIVPLFVPELPEVIDSHGEPLATAAVQFIVPPPAFATLNVVVPADEDTSLLSGITDKTGTEAKFAVCVIGPFIVTVAGLFGPV